jgi:endonuclease/exonuclease/phosphatase family metal-dependent hydrolase
VPYEPSHVTFVLLNVRSIVAKLPDVRVDNNLSCANILCFCETWLNASQPTSVLLDDQVDIRCDRMTNENRGGVLICVPSHMSPTNVQRFATTGIEAVSATIQLPNSDNFQIAVVYRSPSVLQAMLITLLTRLWTHVTLCTVPCVVLGDFNEDILHCQNSAILSLMSSFSFQQIVPYPTAPQATLIDHVYYRNTAGHSMSAIVQVQDTYYSDHDTVYCSFPL